MHDLQTMAHSDSLPAQRGLSSSALDLNQLLMPQTGSACMFRVTGHHWADQGILDGDIAVIDRAIQAGSTDLIVAWSDEGLNLCRQHQLTNSHKPWGVVTAIIHQYRTY